MTASISVNDGSLSVELKGLTNCGLEPQGVAPHDEGRWLR
jgi:hypothetical protein